MARKKQSLQVKEREGAITLVGSLLNIANPKRVIHNHNEEGVKILLLKIHFEKYIWAFVINFDRLLIF